MHHLRPLIYILIAATAACTAVAETAPGEPVQAQPALQTTRPSISFDAAACSGQEGNLQTGLDVFDTPTLLEPSPGLPFLDPVFDSCLVRLTDRSTDLSPQDPSEGLKNEYSRVQSFNADGSRLLIRSVEAFWYLYDAQSLQPLGLLPLSVEPRWDAEDPDLIYHFDEMRLFAYRISTGQNWLVHDFSIDFPGRDLAAVWTRYEGSPSFDGQTWGLMVEDGDWETIAFIIYDLITDSVIARRDLPDGMEVDSVTISPHGSYFLAFFDDFCTDGQLGTDDSPCGLMVYDQDLRAGRGLLRIVGHADTALTEDRREVLVYQDIDTDHISLLDLASGTVTPLFPIDFSRAPLGLHFSGRAEDLPGWALVSTHSGAQPAATWMDDQVFAIELKPGGRVFRLAHTHSLVDEDLAHDYWAEPHASTNRDFTRVLFTSNWGRSGTGAVETFMIALPDGWWLQRH